MLAPRYGVAHLCWKLETHRAVTTENVVCSDVWKNKVIVKQIAYCPSSFLSKS